MNDITTLWTSYFESRNPELEPQIAQYYLPILYKACAKQAQKLMMESHELIGCGYPGLIRAIQKAKPDSINRTWEGYAYQKCCLGIIDELRTESGRKASHQLYQPFSRHKQRVEQALGHRMSDSMAAEVIGMEPIDVQKMRNNVKLSIDHYATHDGDVIEQDQNDALICFDPEPDDFEVVAERLVEDYCSHQPEAFRARILEVLLLKFRDGNNSREASELMGLSESRVSQFMTVFADSVRQKADAEDFRELVA